MIQKCLILLAAVCLSSSIDGVVVDYDPNNSADHDESAYSYSSYVGPLALNLGLYYNNGDGQEDYQDYYAYPRYAYNYGVYDPYTDIRTQHEIRDGDVIQGSYEDDSDSDESLYYDKYSSDPHNDYNAIVKRYGDIVHPLPVPAEGFASEIADNYEYEKHY